jgi:hypothetical protein
MQSNVRTDGAAPTGDDLAALFDELKTADRAIQRAVVLAGQLAGSGVCERVEGGPLEWALGMVCRLTGADRRMIVAAGETLADLPTVRRLWAGALVSWGQIRGIVLAVRRLPVAKRAELDARIAASITAYGGIDAFDPDHLVEAVDVAAAELSDPRNAERREDRQRGANFLSLQLATDGRVRGYFDYDPVEGAVVVNGLDAASPRPKATEDPEPGQPTTRGKQYAAGLVEMAAEYLGGANSGVAPSGSKRRRRRARPLLVAHVQAGDVARGAGGIVELNVRGRLSRICAATLEILARDADVQAVIFDGARPLAVSRKLRAEKIPDDIRTAVLARDMGDRFPGSQDPVGHLDVHHLRHREHGGTNDIDNLAGFSRRTHLGRIHKHGWRIALDPTTGIITARRRQRAWRSLPRSAGLARPPDTRPADKEAPTTLPF